MSWAFVHVRGDRWLLENRTGDDAIDVELEAIGKVSVSNKSGWTRELPEIASGDCVPMKFKVAFGGVVNPPYLRVIWTPANDPENCYYEDVPFP